MLAPQYVHLKSTASPQNIIIEPPFAAIVIVDMVVSSDWRHLVSDWLVEAGCLYVMAQGQDCSLWDDSVDTANLEAFDWGPIPEDRSITTTWHEAETVEDVFEFAINCAIPSSPLIKTSVILDITETPREREMLELYEVVQEIFSFDHSQDKDASNAEGSTLRERLTPMIPTISTGFIILAIWILITFR